jgi:iron-sulfur cluster assembly accessory protein
MITLSETAAQEIKRLQISTQKQNAHLRIKINQGGCAGLFYKLELQETILEGDLQYESQGISIIVESKIISYIDELKIDYSEDLMGVGFRFQNPNSVKNCNCGQSFSAKNT